MRPTCLIRDVPASGACWGFTHMVRRPASWSCVAVAAALVAAACSPAASPSAPPSAATPATAGPSPTPIAIASAAATASASVPQSASPSIAVSPSAAAPSSEAPSASPAASPSYPTYHAIGRLADVRAFAAGDVVTLEVQSPSSGARVNRLTAALTPEPGWPWTTPGMDNGQIGLAPDGGVFVLARVVTSSGFAESLNKLDPAGHELPGFPVALPPVPYCTVAATKDDGAVALCQGATTTTVTSVTDNGRVVAGWPVRLSFGADLVGVTPDGGVLLNESVSETSNQVVKLAPDGRPAPGWHATTILAGSDVRLDGSGLVVAVDHAYSPGECGAAIRTTYLVLDGAGQAAAGWPQTVRGWGSEPVIRDDGSLVATASGGAVHAWSAAGQPLTGWPASGVDVAVACQDGSSPVAAGGGGVLVLGSHRLTQLGANGAVDAAWPATVTGSVAVACTRCTPGPEGPLDPASTDSSVYAPVYLPAAGSVGDGQPALRVYDHQGRPAAFPTVKIGATGDEILWVRTEMDSNVYAALNTTSNAGDAGTLVLVNPS